MASETWRVVLASGEVLSVECLYIGTVALAKVYGLRAEGVAVSGQGDNFVEAILDLARDGRLRVAEILAPGEPTRAELAAQLAATLETRTAEHALAMERVRELEARLSVVRGLVEHLPRNLGASQWGQNLRAALVHTAAASRVPCPACLGRGVRLYGREIEDGCDECEATGYVRAEVSRG